MNVTAGYVEAPETSMFGKESWISIGQEASGF